MSQIARQLLVIVCAALFARADVPLVQKVEDAIRAAEPGWRCVHAVLNAPPPDVAGEKLLVASIWEHTSQKGKRESGHLFLVQVDSPSDAETALKAVREAKVPEGWKVKPYG